MESQLMEFICRLYSLIIFETYAQLQKTNITTYECMCSRRCG